MKNTLRLVSSHPIAAAMCFSFCALLGYSLLAAMLSWLDGRHESWVVPCGLGIDLLMMLLELSTPVAMAVAAAYKTNRILGQRVAKEGYLIVLAFIITY